MMDKKLIKVLEPIEDEFDVDLFTFDEALEFVESDMKSLMEIFDKEIELHSGNPNFADGLFYAKSIVKTFMEIRIDEGYWKMEFPKLDKSTWFYKNCKRQRKANAKICQCCPFRKGIEDQEK